MSTPANTSRLHTPAPSARPPPSHLPMRTTRSAAKKLAQPRASSSLSPVPPETEPGEGVATSATASRSASQAQSRPHQDSDLDVDVVYDSTGEEGLAPADPAGAAVHLAAPLDPIQAAAEARFFSPLAVDPVTPTRTHNPNLPALPRQQALTHPLPKRPDAATVDAALRASPPTKKRKSPPTPDSDNDEDGQLLSEYMCPICFSPPKAAVITPCVPSCTADFPNSNERLNCLHLRLASIVAALLDPLMNGCPLRGYFLMATPIRNGLYLEMVLHPFSSVLPALLCISNVP